MKSWEKEIIVNDNGERVEAVLPEIISASRSTDIPAFYSKWFFNRWDKRHLAWMNPFNRQLQYISFKNTRLVVFWTKNPLPIIPYLSILDQQEIGYYFQFTLNDYEDEGLEPHVPSISKRIQTFHKLSEMIGKEKVIWRFDPFILTKTLTIDKLLAKVRDIGNELVGYTEKLVFSFADIEVYRKVQNNLIRGNFEAREFRLSEITHLVEGLAELNKDWNLSMATCAEKFDLQQYGVLHNRCIDDELIVKLFSHDRLLMDFLGYSPVIQNSLFNDSDYNTNLSLKDKGQRSICGCIVSKDIGMYNTCSHLCTYCYANSSNTLVRKNYDSHSDYSETIVNL
jgi:DNA repair photolyase